MAISVGEIEAVLRLRDELSPALKVAAFNLKQIGGSLKQMGTDLQSAGSAMLPVSAAVGAASIAIVKLGSDFQSTTAKIISLSGVNEKAMAGFSEQVLELSGRVGIGPNSLASALLVVTSTGIRGAEAMQILEMAAKGSAVGLGETKDIARALTSAMTAYGIENLSAAEASEILFKTVREGGAEANELAGVLGRVVGIASQVGVSFDEVGAFLATFTRLGVDSAEAVTALRGTMSTLLKPSKEARDQLIDIGYSIEALRDKVQKEGLTAALIDLVNRTKDSDDAIAAIIPNVRALAGVLGSAGSQAKAMADIQAVLKNKSNDLDEAFKRNEKTLKFQYNQALADMERIGIRAFNALSGHLTSFMGSIRGSIKDLDDFAAGMSKWSDTGKTAFSILTGGLILAAPLLLGLGGTIRVIGFALEGLGVTAGVASRIIPGFLAIAFAPLTAILASIYQVGRAVRDFAGISEESAKRHSGGWASTIPIVGPALGMFRLLADKTSLAGTGIEDMTAKLKGTALAMPKVATSTGFAADAFDRLAESIRESEGTGGTGGGLGTLSDEIKGLADQLSGRALAKEVADLEKAFKSLDPAGQAAALSSGRLRDALKDLAKEGAVLPKHFQDVVDGAKKQEKAWNALIVVWQALKAASKDALDIERKNLDENIKRTAEFVAAREAAFKVALKTAGDVADEVAKIEMSATDYAIMQAGRQYAETMRLLDPLRTKLPEIYKVAADGAKVVLDRMVTDAKTGAQKVVGAFAQALADLPQTIIGAIQGGGDVMKAVLSSLGSGIFGSGAGLNELFNKGLSALATKIGGGFVAGLAHSISTALPGLGAILGPLIGKVLGGIAKGVGSILGLDNPGRDLIKAFLQASGGADKLRESLLVLGAQGEQLWVQLTQNARGPEQVRAAIQAIEDALRKAGDETKKAEEKLKALRDEMGRIASEGGLASAALKEWLAANKDDPEAQSFILGQVKVAGTAIGKMLEAMERAAKAVGKEFTVTAAGAKAMSMILLAAWDGTAEGLRAMAPDIERLRLAMEKSGVTGSKAFTQLTAMAKLASDEITGPMLEAINHGTAALTAMSNSGFLTQEMFQGMVDEIMKQRDALLATGATAETVNGAMRNDLQRIWELWKDSGFQVDENTRKLLENAEAQGLVGDKFRSATDRMVIALERLVKIFSGETDNMAEKFGGLGKKMVDTFNVDMVNAALEGAKKVTEILSGINPTVVIEFSTRWDGSVPGGTVSGGSGGYGAMPQQTLFVGASDSGVMAASSSRGGTIEVHLTTVSQLDGKEVARNQAKHLLNEVDFIGGLR